MGEKISGAGAIAAVISFFLPWISVALLEASASGLDLGKTDGATYLVLLLAIAAGALCYLSSKAAPAKSLMLAGYLGAIGALCGPALLLSLVFVSQLSSVAGFGLWLGAWLHRHCVRRTVHDPRLQQQDVLSRERSRRAIFG